MRGLRVSACSARLRSGLLFAGYCEFAKLSGVQKSDCLDALCLLRQPEQKRHSALQIVVLTTLNVALHIPLGRYLSNRRQNTWLLVRHLPCSVLGTSMFVFWGSIASYHAAFLLNYRGVLASSSAC